MKAIATDSAATPKGYYSQAVRAGDFLFIAGQLPLDREGHVVKGSIKDQTQQALSNVKAILEAAGGQLSNLVQCTIYISEVAHWSQVNETYSAFLEGVPVAPARAMVPVKEMNYGALIEIQAVAHFSSSVRS